VSVAAARSGPASEMKAIAPDVCETLAVSREAPGAFATTHAEQASAIAANVEKSLKRKWRLRLGTRMWMLADWVGDLRGG